MLSFCLLLVKAAVHWSERVYRWRRRRKLRLEYIRDDVMYDEDAVFKDLQNGVGTPQDLEASSSSGSSTLEGTESPPRQVKDVNEVTPVLHIGHTSQVLPQRSSINCRALESVSDLPTSACSTDQQDLTIQ
jgi:hypothetical protein